MTIWKWVIDNREPLGWGCGAAVGTWKFLVFAYKKCLLPFRAFLAEIKNALAELRPNGGGSMKDMAKSNQIALTKISKDITTMKATQEAEFQLNPDCKFECAPDGRCIKVNDAICRLFGASDNQKMLGFGWLNFVKPSEQDHARQIWEDAVETDNAINSSYTIVNAMTGEEVECTYIAYIKRNSETNEIISIFGIVNKK